MTPRCWAEVRARHLVLRQLEAEMGGGVLKSRAPASFVCFCLGFRVQSN